VEAKLQSIAITVSLSQELGPRKIRVNSLNAGMVETEGLRASGLHEGDSRKQQDRDTPLCRIAQPNDIALAATFLAGTMPGGLLARSSSPQVANGCERLDEGQDRQSIPFPVSSS
jgi:NAD(P)-dependent dehydrogenase (short-subunit alcohol dehydrogenase family)